MNFLMNKSKLLIKLILVLLPLLAMDTYASDPTEAFFSVEEIADGLYVHLGVPVTFEDPKHDDIANIGFIIGDKCIAVIDTGGSVNIAKQLKQSIKNVSNKPICYVINTHVHFDHVLGNIVFKDPGTEFVGHNNLPDLIETNREFFISEFKDDLGKFAKTENIIAPTILVKDTLELDLGNRIVKLTAYPSAHSDADLTVYDSKTNTLWLSDLLFIKRIPALDGSLKGWLAVMKKIEKGHYDILVPGHGPISKSMEDLKPQERYLNILLNQIRKKLAEGAFMEEIVDEVGKEEKLHWLLYEQHHKRNVTKAFSELEWE